jgi:flagellar hook-associated protein 2
MAEISFGGLATGLPTEDLVSSLMAIERRPIERLEADKEYEDLRLEAYGEFNGLLNDLRTSVSDLNLTGDVRTTTTRLSNEDAITASSNGATPGSYDIAVVQLAQVQKTVTNGFSSESESLFGTGLFAIGDTVIEVNETNNSLSGLMNSINTLTEETGVSAAIINNGGDSENFHLVLTGKDASTSFSLTYDLKDEENNDVTFNATHVRDAQQAVAQVDGITVVSDTNNLTSVIAGLTVNLNDVSEIITPGSNGNPPVYKTTTLNVEADTDSLKEKISTFVSSYNAVMEWINEGYETEEVAAADSDTDEDSDSDSDENLSAILRGDATINDIKRSLQNILSDSVGNSGSMQILSELGISTQSDGTLYINSTDMQSTLESKFNDVVKLLAGENEIDGVMKKFNSFLLETTSFTDGMYANKRERHDSAIRRLDEQIENKEFMMEKVEARIRAQFNAMELLVSNLNAQSDYLSQQMSAISNLNSDRN